MCKDGEGRGQNEQLDEELCRELLRAANAGDPHRVKVLLQSEGVDPRYAEKHNWRGPTALRLACDSGHVDVARVILEHGGVTREDLESSFVGAASEVGIVKLLLETGVDPAAKDNYGVGAAAENGQIEVVELLLKDPRVDPSADRDFALRLAAHNGHAEMIELLLKDSRVDPAADYDFAVRGAALNGHLEALKVLLADERVDGTTVTAISIAASSVVNVLLEDERCGINVNRHWFENYHKDAAIKYDELENERTAQILAVSWAMKQIGQGWGDLREPTEERMRRLPLDWSRFQ